MFIGREKIQELAEGSQKVALHLKTCCVAQQAHALSSEQFQTCMSAAKDYENRVQQVSNIVGEAQAAQAQGNSRVVEQKSAQAKEGVSAATETVNKLDRAAAALPAVSPPALPPKPVKGGVEQEPNNTILEANPAEMGAAISGAIEPANDVDFYKFSYRDAKNRRDIVAVHLENQSNTLQPAVRVYNEDKSLFMDWTAANAPGANLGFSFSAAAGRTYYVEVASTYGSSAGKYALSLVPQKAYDAYEPNDDAFTATPIQLGQVLEANIMDGPDLDWYHLSGIKNKSVTVRLENQSTTLQPAIRVYHADKSLHQDWTAANAQGADLQFSFDCEPGKEYYLEVTSTYGSTAGKYKLSTH